MRRVSEHRLDDDVIRRDETVYRMAAKIANYPRTSAWIHEFIFTKWTEHSICRVNWPERQTNIKKFCFFTTAQSIYHWNLFLSYPMDLLCACVCVCVCRCRKTMAQKLNGADFVAERPLKKPFIHSALTKVFCTLTNIYFLLLVMFAISKSNLNGSARAYIPSTLLLIALMNWALLSNSWRKANNLRRYHLLRKWHILPRSKKLSQNTMWIIILLRNTTRVQITRMPQLSPAIQRKCDEK